MESRIRRLTKSGILWLLLAGLLSGMYAWADEGNISTTDKFAWSETVGWINFRPTDGGVTVHENGANGFLSGFAWAENVGWIKMGSSTSGPFANTTNSNWGVNIDAAGNMSGYAWSENAGWINFNPTHSQVTMDAVSDEFDDYAWAENFGWVHFQNTSPDYVVAAFGSPTAVCQDVTVDADANCGAAASIDNGSSDGNGGPFTLSQSPAGPYPLGPTLVTLTASDGLLEATCSATVTVVDNTNPTITCPADITVGADPGFCGVTVNFNAPGVGDNCPGVSFNCDRASGSFFDVGTTQVNCTATDASNNTAQCSFDVTVDSPAADLSITKSDDPDPVLQDTILTYTITVNNAGPCDAENVVVTDTLPAGVTFDSTNGCLESPGGVPDCGLGNIAAGGSAMYTIDVLVDLETVGTITNTASVTSDTADPGPGVNTISIDTLVITECDLSVSQLLGMGYDQVIDGGPGNDDMVGFNGQNVVLRGLSGNDTLRGRNGDDLLCGGDGNDRLFGLSGNDLLLGGPGEDEINGNSGHDELRGEAGDDILNGGGDNDMLEGGADNDELRGHTGNDLLFGGSGDDELFGQGGNDTLDGGDGIDDCNGNAGADTEVNCEQ